MHIRKEQHESLHARHRYCENLRSNQHCLEYVHVVRWLKSIRYRPAPTLFSVLDKLQECTDSDPAFSDKSVNSNGDNLKAECSAICHLCLKQESHQQALGRADGAPVVEPPGLRQRLTWELRPTTPALSR